MLSKSSCDLIAKRSVLSAPDTFLPRLLLCCGLPQSSFSTLIERLDSLGQLSSDKDKAYRQLLSSSTKGEWMVLKRNKISRMLLGRISAYINLLNKNSSESVCVVSAMASASCFISWLEAECKKAKEKYSSKKLAMKSTFNPTLIVSKVIQSDYEGNFEISSSKENECTPFCDLKTKEMTTKKYEILTEENIQKMMQKKEFDVLNRVLKVLYKKVVETIQSKYDTNKEAILNDNIPSTLIIESRMVQERHPTLCRLMMEWIPKLTKNCQSKFWSILFNDVGFTLRFPDNHV